MVFIASGAVASWGAASCSLLTSCSVTGVSTGVPVAVACAIADSAKHLSLGALIVKAAASSAVASSVFGVIVSGSVGAGAQTFSAAAISAAAGALSGAGSSALAATTVAADILLGPVGSVLLGADGESDEITYDCWKAVVRDGSDVSSSGRLLRDVAASPLVKEVLVTSGKKPEEIELSLLNIWDELFRIDFLFLSSGKLAAHAIRV